MFNWNSVHRLTRQLVQVSARQAHVNHYARATNEIFDKVREIRANADSIEPSKLFVVELIATTAFRPYWEKRIIEDLGLQHTKRERLRNIRKGIGTYVVVKNTPEMCRVLWQVKHLIRIKPVTFPDGLPTPGVFTGTHLDRNGVFRKNAKFEVDPSRLQLEEKFVEKKLTGMEIAKPMHLHWMNAIS